MLFRLFTQCATVLFFSVSATWLTHTSAAPPEPSYSAQLERLREKIRSLKAEVDRDESKRDVIREALHRSERRIGGISAELRSLRATLDEKNRRIQRLNADRDLHQRRLTEQADIFGRMVYATYIMGRQGYIKMLLNQKDPAKLGRAITYYRYFARARSHQIDAINQSLTSLTRLREHLEGENRELSALEQTQLENRRALELRQRERGILLAKLNEKIRSRSDELEMLRRDERRLERLLAELTELMQEVPLLQNDEASFDEMKGRLTLPVRGTIEARFNQHKKGNMRWQGLFLKAPEDRVVHAVFRGRVAFADWLRGFGLLLIIDHGDGYMSLYSHNKLLYKEVGDWVDAGDPIAAVGNSGGLNQTGLYFEIRHNGKPRNPLLWCKAG